MVEGERLRFNEPQTGANRARYEALTRGDVASNDLGSFPSDHAGFYFTLSLGIFFASRRAGAVALGWSLLVIFATRIVTGMHSPLDTVAGMLIGTAVLLPILYLARRSGRRLLDPLARWTMRHGALASALLFLALFEASNTLVNLQELLETGVAAVEHYLV
jgi:undecaprenyl-diphosphatase